MKTKKIYLLLIIVFILLSLFLFNKDVIFQEGNPISVLKGIIQLNGTSTFVRIKDNPITYVTKTGNSEELFNYIKKEYNVVFKEQMGSGHIFEGSEKSVILTSKQYTRFYQIWEYSDLNIISLKFSAIMAEALKERLPNENMIYEKSISLENLFDQEEVVIDLYFEKSQEESVESNAVDAFLQYNNKVYELGTVSNYGLEDLKVEAVDRTFDGKNEIEIVGELGATYIEMKLIGYNEETKELVNLLTMGTPEYIDLDHDGTDELIGVSAGIVPGYVNIYRWNGKHFEMAEISKVTKSLYSGLENKKDTLYIVTGNYDENNKMIFRYFIYKSGKIFEQ